MQSPRRIIAVHKVNPNPNTRERKESMLIHLGR